MSLGDWFGWPAAWPVLGCGPLIWFVGRLRVRANARRFARGVGPRVEELAEGVDHSRRRSQVRWFAAGIACLSLAVLQPSWGEVERSLEQRSAEIIVCLDVSRSMLARDLLPNRLARAQHEIGLLAQRARGDRLGLVVFAGDARLVVPRTTDVESFVEMLGQASPVSVERGGTDLGAALQVALGALDGLGERPGAIVLLTDGDDVDERGIAFAPSCRERGVVVHCIGLGSALGSKIAVDDGGGEVFLRDRAGVEVVTAMNPDGLRRIAAATGGEFVAAASRPRPLVDLYERRIVPMARESVAGELVRERGNHFQIPLLVGVLLLLWEIRSAEVRRR